MTDKPICFFGVALALSVFVSASATAQTGRQITEPEKAAVRLAIEQRLMDPMSAQYRWLPAIGKDGAYCGYVNAKNRYGGYIGFAPFLAWIRKPNEDGSPRVVLNMLAVKPSNWSDYDVRAYCREAGIDMDQIVPISQ